jgi:hypothetical protein
MILKPKNKNFKDQYKIKEQVKKMLSGATFPYQGFFNYITLGKFLTGDTVPLSRVQEELPFSMVTCPSARCKIDETLKTLY